MTILGIAIVRDEIDYIDSLLSAPVDQWLIYDTGSVDGTVEALIGRGVPVVERPWVNFGHNRSELLDAARFVEPKWLLMLDADMTVEWDKGWVPDPAVEAYTIAIHERNNPGFVWRMPLLLRGDLPWKSVGVVHEYATLPDRLPVTVPTDAVRITYQDRSSPAKTARYAEMLEEAWSEDPNNPRTAFYLAQTWREMGDPRAAAMYQHRISLGGWDQETYYAMYRRALLLPWPEQALALMAAWEFRPSRKEALWSLAEGLNRHDLHHAAYAVVSSSRGPASDDSLFVHHEADDWGLDFEEAIALWWMGLKKAAAAANADLLTRDLPDRIRTAVERNLTFG